VTAQSLAQLAAAYGDGEQLTWELLGVLEASGFDYQTFCSLLAIDPRSKESEAIHGTIHKAYPKMWTAVGQDEFTARLAPITARWLLHSKAKVRPQARSLST
jgi:hypothetical protein